MCRLRSLTLLLALVASTALAADHPIGGDRVFLKDSSDTTRRAMRFRATRDTAIDPSVAADPRVGGATVEFVGTGAGDGTSGVITLDAQLWVGLGRPEGSRGYKFLDLASTNGVKKAFFKRGNSGGSLILSGGGSNWPYAITQAQQEVKVRFTVGADLYCAEFTTFDRNEPEKVIARNAPAPQTCSTPVPPVCGNGSAEGTEECDDGDTQGGDGCSATCQLENTSALCAGVPSQSGTALASVRIASGLQRPVFVTAPPLDTNRLFVIEQNGRIRIIKNGALLPAPFLTVSPLLCCGEQGLLSMAFHPDYEQNGRFFVTYNAPGGGAAGHSVVAEYAVSGGNPDVADPDEVAVLLSVDDPFGNHNGGLITFGPDGMLYFALGDGGGGGDPLEAGQDDANPLGKLFRINVDAPPANPLDAVWGKGLRNPWRFSFDRLTGDLYIGDVGQGTWEEVNFQAGPTPASGVNYGWDLFEGRHCYEPAPLYPAGDCSDVPAGLVTDPVLEYNHSQGCSITGGYVYRGCAMPDLHGTYFYSDYCTAFIRTFNGVSGGDAQNLVNRTADLAPGGGLSIDNVTSFGEDARGEMYITDHGSGGFDGEVFKIIHE
jgi:cysteine-rich repeat protein